MKAIVFTKYGSPDVLQLEVVDKPQPGDGEVLVKVLAASINSWDQDLLRGTPLVNRFMAGLLKPKRIQILGCDIAGRVEAVGKNVKRFQPGDEVFGDLSRCGWGGFAEYVSVREKDLAVKPACLSFEQAAAVPQAGLLALQGLCDKGKLQSGQAVLINGAGGGVGTFAIQIAKLFGADVTGVDHTAKLEVMRSLGVDHVIDYTHEDFTRSGQQYDLILDVQGCHSLFDYRRVLNPGGIYVMVGGSSALANQVIFLGPWISMIGGKKTGLLLHKANKGLARMTELLEAGTVAPVIDRCYPLEETAEAFRYFGEGHVKGKVVITLVHDNRT